MIKKDKMFHSETGQATTEFVIMLGLLATVTLAIYGLITALLNYKYYIIELFSYDL